MRVCSEERVRRADSLTDLLLCRRVTLVLSALRGLAPVDDHRVPDDEGGRI